MVGWSEVIVDIVLCFFYVFILIRLATASDGYFKTPFYIFFITTGVYSVLSILTYHVVAQFSFSLEYWTIHFYKIAFGATIGKAFIAIHRYYVMRSQDFSEKKLSRSTIRRLLAVQCLTSVASMAPVWVAAYECKNEGTPNEIVVLARINTLIIKGIAIGSYVLYIICNGICTIITSRELLRLKTILGDNTATSRTIMTQQRSMYIIVTVCSLSHLVKALQQFIIAVSTYFDLIGLYNFIWPLYPVSNGLASYAAPLCLVLLSPKVRTRLVCGIRPETGSSTVEITPSNLA